MSHIKCPEGKKCVSSCPFLSPQCLLHHTTLYWLLTLWCHKETWNRRIYEVPLGLLLWRANGKQGCALKLLTVIHLWDRHSFSQNLAAKMMMSTDNSNYGLISIAKDNGQIKSNRTKRLTRA